MKYLHRSGDDFIAVQLTEIEIRMIKALCDAHLAAEKTCQFGLSIEQSEALACESADILLKMATLSPR